MHIGPKGQKRPAADRDEAFDETLKKVAGASSMSVPNALPRQSDVEYALLRLLIATPKGMTARQAYDSLADTFELDFVQTQKRMGNQWAEPRWHNRVRQSHRALINRGWAIDDGSLNWRITAKGANVGDLSTF